MGISHTFDSRQLLRAVADYHRETVHLEVNNNQRFTILRETCSQASTGARPLFQEPHDSHFLSPRRHRFPQILMLGRFLHLHKWRHNVFRGLSRDIL